MRLPAPRPARTLPTRRRQEEPTSSCRPANRAHWFRKSLGQGVKKRLLLAKQAKPPPLWLYWLLRPHAPGLCF